MTTNGEAEDNNIQRSHQVFFYFPHRIGIIQRRFILEDNFKRNEQKALERKSSRLCTCSLFKQNL